MKLELTEKEAVKVLLLVKHYQNLITGGCLPVNQSTVDFYESLYNKIGQQIEDQKEGAEDA